MAHTRLTTNVNVVTNSLENPQLAAVEDREPEVKKLQTKVDSITRLYQLEKQNNERIQAELDKEKIKSSKFEHTLPSESRNTGAPALGIFTSLTGVGAGIYLAIAASIPVIGWAVLIGASAIALGFFAYHLAANRNSNSFFKVKENIDIPILTEQLFQPSPGRKK